MTHGLVGWVLTGLYFMLEALRCQLKLTLNLYYMLGVFTSIDASFLLDTVGTQLARVLAIELD
jgi:hypothetical protein